MNYMLLIYFDEVPPTLLPQAEREINDLHCLRVAEEIQSEGYYVSAARLYPTSTATSIRMRDGRRLITDGPFAETREQLAGYLIVDAENLDAAMELASRLTPAQYGTIEIRPVMDFTSQLEEKALAEKGLSSTSLG